MAIKWEGRHDSVRLRQDVARKEADALLQAAADRLIERCAAVTCECCGIVDPCTTNGVCPECRQGMGIG
jgi:hypothetical protein